MKIKKIIMHEGNEELNYWGEENRKPVTPNVSELRSALAERLDLVESELAELKDLLLSSPQYSSEIQTIWFDGNDNQPDVHLSVKGIIFGREIGKFIEEQHYIAVYDVDGQLLIRYRKETVSLDYLPRPIKKIDPNPLRPF